MVKVAASRITSVQANRDPMAGAVQALGMNINFDNIKFEKNNLVVSFTYTVTYEKNVGKLTVKGEIFLEDANLKKIEEEYKKTQTLSIETAEEIVTAAGFSGGAAGTLLAYTLSLPAPINVPRAKLTPQSVQAVSPKKAS